MPEIPECMNRRYHAIDDLIRELSAMSQQTRCSNCPASEPGVKLMCDFWNILKEDPTCNLSQQVHKCMCPSETCSYQTIPSQRFNVYMANEVPADGSPDAPDGPDAQSTTTPTPTTGGQTPAHCASEAPPLSKVLCNLKKAATFDKDCNYKLKELLAAEKHLRGQIAHLEGREKEGANLLKEADAMWSSMEDAYKEKIAESLNRQKELLREIQSIEKCAAKWRKNRKDLESQLESINRCQLEMSQKINQKTNDLKCIDAEIAGFKKRIEATKTETDTVKKSLANKKKISDARIASLSQEIAKLEKEIQEELSLKKQKDKEGAGFIKEAREDLQKLCKLMLQKKLENEDLFAEKNALIEEINMLKDQCGMCKDRCKKKQTDIGEEIKKIDIEIANFQLKCVKCHQCTDTTEARQFCIDCARCEAERKCLIEGNECKVDGKEECVCQMVKQKFLDNVFENMYSILEKNIQSNDGKLLADEILNCLKQSRNGKLNDRTRRSLQEFILSTVKKNLNLTIVGGAVKTRCELDKPTYDQLMLCLKQVKTVKAPKTDKGTDVKKDPCNRWGGPQECNCPKGPKACVCVKKAPPPAKEPKPCPPDKEDKGQVVKCPHRSHATACGPECGAHADKVGTDVSTWRPDPCSGPTCVFGKNMRAAQCVLGPESLTVTDKPMKTHMHGQPHVPSISVLEDQIVCKCGRTPIKPCACSKDQRTVPRQQIIDEVIGRYIDVTPIEKVSTIYENQSSELSMDYDHRVRLNTAYNENYANYATNAFVNRAMQSRNKTAQRVLEDIWINKSNAVKEDDKNNLSSERAKNVSFPECDFDSSSQETLVDYSIKSVDINIKPTQAMKKIENTRSCGRTASRRADSTASSQDVLSSVYCSCSNFQSSHERYKNSKSDSKSAKMAHLSVEWSTLSSFLQNINNYDDNAYEPSNKRVADSKSSGVDKYGITINDNEFNSYESERDTRQRCRPKNPKVYVMVRKNKVVEDILKSDETKVKVLKKILKRRK